MEETPKGTNLPQEKKNLNIDKATTPENEDNDYTFNRLREIQLLIKKESGLKELCK